MGKNKQAAPGFRDPGERRVEVVRSYGSMQAAQQVLCGMQGHLWSCRRDYNGQDVCNRCELTDDCGHLKQDEVVSRE